jgi:hypothetical protein
MDFERVQVKNIKHVPASPEPASAAQGQIRIGFLNFPTKSRSTFDLFA